MWPLNQCIKKTRSIIITFTVQYCSCELRKCTQYYNVFCNKMCQGQAHVTNLSEWCLYRRERDEEDICIGGGMKYNHNRDTYKPLMFLYHEMRSTITSNLCTHSQTRKEDKIKKQVLERNTAFLSNEEYEEIPEYICGPSALLV